MSAPDPNLSQHDGAERALELLADRALFGLDTDEHFELERLLAEQPGLDDESMEMSAAALDLAFGPSNFEPLPDSVRTRLEQTAESWRRDPADGASPAPVTVPVKPHTSHADRPDPPADVVGRIGVPVWTGWLAAAAALLLAFLAWWPTRSLTTSASADLVRARVLASEDAMTAPWAGTEDELVGAAGGDVVWSSDLQQGVMRISGLAPNDPTATQYQLWIFDETRDDRYPVDGGVFDVPAGETEILVPIEAKLAVDTPVLFAVTVEPPGGVVVSDRRIVLVANPPASTDETSSSEE